MAITRRGFIGAASAGVTSAGALIGAEAEGRTNRKAKKRPLIVSTWPFGQAANEKALATFAEGGTNLDAVEQGIRVTEADIQNSSVGIGGLPNAKGVVQLDACIMDGPQHRAGSVMALEGIKHPVSVARKVMEETRHVQLVGQGAKDFALSQGFEVEDLLSGGSRKRWEEWKASQPPLKEGDKDNHDTIALLALGADGNIAGGCSTSGLAFKLAGRVGDSPIIGGGLYVDNGVGAAGATGVGENVLRYCGSFLVVEFMRQGLDPEAACVKTLERIASIDPLGIDLNIYFIALDKQGRFGAAGTGRGFEYAVTTPEKSAVLKSAALSDLDVGPIGGNEFYK